MQHSFSHRLTRRALLRSAGLAAASLALPARVTRATPTTGPTPAVAGLRYGGFRMGIQSFTLRAFDLEGALDATAALGLTQIELIPDTRVFFWRFGRHFDVTDDKDEIARVRTMVTQRGLDISAHGVNGLGSVAEAKTLIAFAEAAAIPVLTIHPKAALLPELDDLLIAHPNVKLAIHNHGPGFTFQTIDDVEAALEGRPANLGACVDTGHFIRSGVDPVEALQRLVGRVYGVHLKDFASTGWAPPSAILGEGLLDLDGVFRALRAIGFPSDGALSLEYEDHSDEVLPWVEANLRAASAAAERTLGSVENAREKRVVQCYSKAKGSTMV